MKKIFLPKFSLAILIITSMVLSLTACSADTNTSSDTTGAAAEAIEITAESTSAPETTGIAAEATAATEKTPIRIAALKGPTGIGLVNMMAGQDAGTTLNDYSFSLSGSPDDIVAQLSSGEADIAALPTNLAAVLYQKTNKSIQVIAVNTLGVLYILEKGDEVHSMADLSGRELSATGQASVPEYVLNDLLVKSEISESVTVSYKAEHAELATLAAAGEVDLVMLPEPFVTTVLQKNPDYRIALNLTDEWQKIYEDTSGSELAMGCLVVTKEFAAAYPDAMASFMTEYEASTESVNADPAAAGILVAQYGIMADSVLAEKSIPNCNIVMIQGTPMKDILSSFYKILMEANPKSIGGMLPDSEFYWTL